MSSSQRVRTLSESAMMIALSTVLSVFKIIELPYGGSVTVASMLPMIILAYRCGIVWGLGSGLVYAVLQQLLGLNTLSYVTGWQSVVAIISLDYIVAFTVVGLGGIFRKSMKKQKHALALGALLVSLLRYVCHVISGATVWAGLSIPDSAALIYSISYNATYMLPEAIILISVAFYLGGAVDFSKEIPVRMISESEEEKTPVKLLSGLSALLGLLVDVWLIAPNLQNGETGEFDFSSLANVEWVAVAIVTALSAAASLFFFFASKKKSTSKQ